MGEGGLSLFLGAGCSHSSSHVTPSLGPAERRVAAEEQLKTAVCLHIGGPARLHQGGWVGDGWAAVVRRPSASVATRALSVHHARRSATCVPVLPAPHPVGCTPCRPPSYPAGPLHTLQAPFTPCRPPSTPCRSPSIPCRPPSTPCRPPCGGPHPAGPLHTVQATLLHVPPHPTPLACI